MKKNNSLAITVYYFLITRKHFYTRLLQSLKKRLIQISNKKNTDLLRCFVFWWTIGGYNPRPKLLAARMRRHEVLRVDCLTEQIWLHKKTPIYFGALFFGGRSGARTPDPLIKSQLLYQLS